MDNRNRDKMNKDNVSPKENESSQFGKKVGQSEGLGSSSGRTSGSSDLGSSSSTKRPSSDSSSGSSNEH